MYDLPIKSIVNNRSSLLFHLEEEKVNNEKENSPKSNSKCDKFSLNAASPAAVMAMISVTYSPQPDCDPNQTGSVVEQKFCAIAHQEWTSARVRKSSVKEVLDNGSMNAVSSSTPSVRYPLKLLNCKQWNRTLPDILFDTIIDRARRTRIGRQDGPESEAQDNVDVLEAFPKREAYDAYRYIVNLRGYREKIMRYQNRVTNRNLSMRTRAPSAKACKREAAATPFEYTLWYSFLMWVQEINVKVSTAISAMKRRVNNALQKIKLSVCKHGV